MELPAFLLYSLEQVFHLTHCCLARVHGACLSAKHLFLQGWSTSCWHSSTMSAAEGFEEAHRFSAFANWIIPGHVMLGRYPYVEPSRCR